MRDAKDGSLIGEVVIILVLADSRQQQQPDELSHHHHEKRKNAAAIFGAFKRHSVRMARHIKLCASTSGRQRCTNAIGKIWRIIGHLRNLVDQGSLPQFVERQRGVHPTRVVEIAVDQAFE